MNIYQHHLLYAHSSYLYHIKWMIYWYQKIYFTEFHNVFAFQTYSLVEVTYLLIRFNKTKFFPWNTNNTDRNGVNKQNITLRMEKRIR